MVPVILLTGFLGSGKTTLLNRLFRARPPGGRFAIVVNEFGDVGIDGDLLPEGATRQVELPGGCVCCALVEDLETSLVELLDSEPGLEQIILETTGIADPLPISWTLAGDKLGDRLRLATVITVVDPFEHEASRAQSPSADAQVRHADLLVVSKLDQASAAEELLDGLRARNDVAPILTEQPDALPAALWKFLEDPDLASAAADAAPHHHDHGHSEPHNGIQSVSISLSDTYDLEELVAALEELPPEVIRVKGIVRAVDSEAGETDAGLFAVHRVGARVSTEPYQGRGATRAVALGRDLQAPRLADCFRRAVLRC